MFSGEDIALKENFSFVGLERESSVAGSFGEISVTTVGSGFKEDMESFR